MGSISEKVLRVARSPVLLVRATEGLNSDGEATLNSVVVSLDGSGLAETVLSSVRALARELGLEVMLSGLTKLPPTFTPRRRSFTRRSTTSLATN